MDLRLGRREAEISGRRGFQPQNNSRHSTPRTSHRLSRRAAGPRDWPTGPRGLTDCSNAWFGKSYHIIDLACPQRLSITSKHPEVLSLVEARRIALAAQGFDRPRPAGRVSATHFRSTIRLL